MEILGLIDTLESMILEGLAAERRHVQARHGTAG